MALKLVVYAISKNELVSVDGWMESMGEADEIVVLDTGSDDGTAERLRRLGAKVSVETFTPWRFDVARNRSLELVPADADICVCTDIDERFTPGWAAAFKEAWTANPGTNQLTYRYIWNQIERNGKKVDGVSFWYEKVHARRGFRWVLPVHEVLAADVPVVKTEVGSVTLRHMQVEKATRSNYLPLLELAHDEAPSDLRTLHYLAREYYFYGRNEDAKRLFRQHITDSAQTGWHDEKGKSMVYLARILRAEGDIPAAEYWALRAVAEMAGREPHLFLAQLYCDTGRYHEAKYYADLALSIPRNEVYLRDPDCYWALPYLLAQVADWHLGLKDEARKHAEKCLEFEPDNQTYRQNMLFYSDAAPAQQDGTPEPAGTSPRIDAAPLPSVGIAVAANNLDAATVEQFLRVREILAPGDEVFLADKATLGPYNPARNKNTAIAAAIRSGKQIVIQTDIDMAISKELLEKTRRAVRDGVYFFSRCVDHLGALNRDGYGAWNALTSADWLKTGGLDERMFGYGYEDTAFFFDREKDGSFEVVQNTESYPVHQPHLAPRAWNGVDYTQQQRNYALMSVPRTRNYLSGRLAGFSNETKKHIRFAQFFTNSTCPRACRQCNQQRYLNLTRGWEATLDDVEFFIRCAELQNYRFERVILAGGDPYLWKNLEEAVRMFHASPAFGGVNLFTGVIDEKLTRRIEPLMQYIGLSYYGVEPEFTSPKMEVDRTSASHWVLPAEPVPGTLPADCCCFGPNIRAGRVYRCSNLPDLLLAGGEPLEAADYSEPLTSQFLDLYLDAGIYQDYHCASCVANLNLRSHLEKEPNTDQKVLVRN